MPGCCALLFLLFFGPRVALFLAWVFGNWYQAFDSPLLALLGWIFLPWTSLAWILAYFNNGGEVSGIYTILVVLALLADLGVLGGGAHHRRWRQDEAVVVEE